MLVLIVNIARIAFFVRQAILLAKGVVEWRLVFLDQRIRNSMMRLGQFELDVLQSPRDSIELLPRHGRVINAKARSSVPSMTEIRILRLVRVVLFFLFVDRCLRRCNRHP
jgi:hypothetical protein